MSKRIYTAKSQIMHRTSTHTMRANDDTLISFSCPWHITHNQACRTATAFIILRTAAAFQSVEKIAAGTQQQGDAMQFLWGMSGGMLCAAGVR